MLDCLGGGKTLRIGVVTYQTRSTGARRHGSVAERMTRELRAQGHEAFLITRTHKGSEPAIGAGSVEEHGAYFRLFDEQRGMPVIRMKNATASRTPGRVADVDFLDALTGLVDELSLDALIADSALWKGPEEVPRVLAWRKTSAEDGGPKGPVALCYISRLGEAGWELDETVEGSPGEATDLASLAQIAKEADLLLVANPVERDEMMALGASEERCFLFPGGIDDTTSVASPPLSIKGMGSLGSKKLITTMGAVGERENIFAVLDVARKLSGRKDLYFAIAGRAVDGYGQECTEMAAVMENVSLVGEISDEEKLSLMRRSFVELTMGRADGADPTQLQFLAEGVPIVSAGAGSQAWMVSGGANGLVVQGPEDIAGAAAAITRLADDGRLHNRMATMARRSAWPFTMPRLVRKLAAKLEGTVSRLSPRSEPSHSAPASEKTLESVTDRGREVIATNRRLIINASNSPPVSVPYERITRIARYVEFPWLILLSGLAASAILLVGTIMHLSVINEISGPLARDLLRHSVRVPVYAVALFLVLLPSVAGLVFSAATTKRGYLIYQAGASTIYIPGRFLKVLRVINRLVSQDLMKD